MNEGIEKKGLKLLIKKRQIFLGELKN